MTRYIIRFTGCCCKPAYVQKISDSLWLPTHHKQLAHQFASMTEAELFAMNIKAETVVEAAGNEVAA